MRTKWSRGPAYEVQTSRMVLRCWRPEVDAAAAQALMEANDAYLRRFIPFASEEPLSVDGMADWLRGHRAKFDGDEHYRYAARDHDGTLPGEVMLLDREQSGEREVGYWIAEAHSRRGYATEGTAAMIRLAFELDGVEHVQLNCSPVNTGSVTVAKRLGFEHRSTSEHERPVSPDDRESMHWVVDRARFGQNEAPEMMAFDVLGRPLVMGP